MQLYKVKYINLLWARKYNLEQKCELNLSVFFTDPDNFHVLFELTLQCGP